MRTPIQLLAWTLAVLLKCRLVTVDDRLRRGTERFGIVIGPGDL